MKPSKSRVFCRDCGRQKIAFESEKKANNFIKFNSEEIRTESGYSPNRSYHCVYCNAWHVTSKEDSKNIKSVTEVVLENYSAFKKKQNNLIAKATKTKKKNEQELNNLLSKIEEQSDIIEVQLNFNQFTQLLSNVESSLCILEQAKLIDGSKKRKRNAEIRLLSLKTQIERMIAN